jgi:hypothetical protein
MAVYTETLNTNYNFPHIDIYNRYKDGVQTAYRAYPHEGYVMYDTTDYYTETQFDPETGEPLLDPETGEPIEIPVRHYFTMAGLSLRTNFDNFTWVAVSRSEVDENYIFGGGDNNNNHEVM